MNNQEIIQKLYRKTGTDAAVLQDPGVAHLAVDYNEVLSSRLVPGLVMDVTEQKKGIRADIIVKEGTIIEKMVHLCFGVIAETGVQKIVMNIDAQKNSRISVLAHCIFPNALDLEHIMEAEIKIAEGAEYSYLEKHVHGPEGGIKVYPKAAVSLGERARFKSEFELIRGRVGLVDIDYTTVCGAESVLEMTTRVNGSGDDIIKVKETGHLAGEYARGALTSKIALRDYAKAEIYNKMTATAAYARGHVDCKEIVQDNAQATAIPIVEVNHPKAHITHEAAIGSVDSKQLQTLMSRGLTEDDAVELIIEGLLE
jgi:Fe-S cluster assembly scaffold protein SufB